VRNRFQRKERKSNHKFEVVQGQELMVRKSSRIKSLSQDGRPSPLFSSHCETVGCQLPKSKSWREIGMVRERVSEKLMNEFRGEHEADTTRLSLRHNLVERLQRRRMRVPDRDAFALFDGFAQCQPKLLAHLRYLRHII